jgi:hypothetical protein
MAVCEWCPQQCPALGPPADVHVVVPSGSFYSSQPVPKCRRSGRLWSNRLIISFERYTYIYDIKMGNSTGSQVHVAYAKPDRDQAEVDKEGKIFQQYSLCIVFPVDESGGFTPEGHNFLNIVRSNGLETLAYYGYNKTEIFVLVRANLDVLRNYADDIYFPKLLDPGKLSDIAEKGLEDLNIAPFPITHLEEVSTYNPYEFIYGKYSLRIDETVYSRSSRDETPFHDTLRLKLTCQLVEKPTQFRERLAINRQIRENNLKGYFPLHDEAELDSLKANWMKYPITPWKQPFDHLVRYFGEKIGLYFIFLGHYSWWCVSASVVGIPLQIAVFVMLDFSAPFLPVFSYFIALWGIIMLEFWKRKESEWAMKWGTLGCESTESVRSEYEGGSIKSYVDGRDIVYFSKSEKNRLAAQSMLGIVALICLVVGAVASIYVIRFTLQPFIGSSAQTIASCINSIQIQIASMIYYSLAIALNDKENHRTETMHEDALISKIFLFEFVNNYASFFYLAFFAELLNSCPPKEDGGCMYPLTLNLAIIFVVRMIAGTFLEIMLPIYNYQWKLRSTLKEENIDVSSLTQPEREFLLEPYDSHIASITDFTDLVVQFGYASMFAAALPISPCFSLISNFFLKNGDAWKLLNLHQRPQPVSCQDIGTWQAILTIVSVISVITNASLSVFTMTITDHLSYFTRFWIYIGFQWTCFAIQAGIMQALPDVSSDVLIQQERTAFLVDKVINQTPDDEIVEFSGASSLRYAIQPHPVRDNVNLQIPEFVLTSQFKNSRKSVVDVGSATKGTETDNAVPAVFMTGLREIKQGQGFVSNTKDDNKTEMNMNTTHVSGTDN